MTYRHYGVIEVDQFIAAAPNQVWKALTTPELLARWWVPGDVSEQLGHEFTLQMPGFGAIACTVIECEPNLRFAYTFNGEWTLTWTLVAEGRGTRLLLQHSGFDLDQQRQRNAADRMGPGWRDTVLPRLAQLLGHRTSSATHST